MRLLANKVIRRQVDDSIESEQHVKKLADFVDEQQETTEVMSVNEVEVDGILWARDKGIFHVQLALGGRDSSGRFHRDLKYETALVHWDRRQQADLWQKYGLENARNIDFDQIKFWLHEEDGVNRCGRDVWLIPELESQLTDDAGQIISDYKRQPRQGLVPPVIPGPELPGSINQRLQRQQ